MAIANVISDPYNPTIWAQEALAQLEPLLGMAPRVTRRYAKNVSTAGSVVSIPVPSVFTAVAAPSQAQALQTDKVNISLDQWYEVKFLLTDQEIAYTTERIIRDHIRPAAVALANKIDQSIIGLYKDIPWVKTWTSTAAVADITGARAQLLNNNAPMDGGLHCMVDPTIEAELLSLSAFAQQQGAGQTGVETQRTASLGMKYGIEFFTNQNTPTHTTATIADLTGALTADAAAGAKAVSLDSITAAAVIETGAWFTLAGDSQAYAVTTGQTANGGAITNLAFTPGLSMAHATGDVITFGMTSAKSARTSLMFHESAFALAMAELPETGNGIGARITVVPDPITGISLRSRVFYDGDASAVCVALDALWGVKTLNSNLCVRIQD